MDIYCFLLILRQLSGVIRISLPAGRFIGVIGDLSLENVS